MKKIILITSLLLSCATSVYAGANLDFDLDLPDGSGTISAHIGDHHRPSVVVTDRRPTVVVTDHRPSVVVSNHYPRGAYWQDWPGYIPRGAMSGGYENGQPLYICRAEYRGGLHPGKVIGENCNISYGGREILRRAFQVMVANPRNFNWIFAPGGLLPAGAVRGGDEEGHSLYICHGRYMGAVHPGKVVGNKCNIGYGGREILLSHYQVLTRR